jgi:hypothetical protein
MRSILLLLSLLLLFHGWAVAEPVRALPQEKHPGGTRIEFPDPTFQFTIPDAFTGFLSPGGDVFVIERDRESGYMLMISVSDRSIEELQNILYQYLPYEDDLHLIPTAMPKVQGSRVTAFYTSGSGDAAIKGRALAELQDDGTAVILFAIGPSAYMEEYGRLIIEITESLSFASEKQAGP